MNTRQIHRQRNNVLRQLYRLTEQAYEAQDTPRIAILEQASGALWQLLHDEEHGGHAS